jgi:hypothetical protein
VFDWSDTVSYTATNTNSNPDTLSDCNSHRDRPSYSNADGFRLPRRRRRQRLPIAISDSARHGDTFADANTATNTQSNGDAFARASSGLEYLDAIAR